ncbi:MAG: hypothetical protein ACR2NM_00860, partial [Bythopirellula sp.]
NESLDRPAITTDIIVGFPGETDAEFQQTCEVAREVGFSKIHVFPFSARRTTPAAEMPGQLPKKIKQQRGHELSRVEAELRDAYFERLRGMELKVLVESPCEDRPGKMLGTACRYCPTVVDAEVPGDFVNVTAHQVEAGKILSG